MQNSNRPDKYQHVLVVSPFSRTLLFFYLFFFTKQHQQRRGVISTPVSISISCLARMASWAGLSILTPHIWEETGIQHTRHGLSMMSIHHLRRLLHGALTSPRAATDADIPLWVLIVIVIGGTVILVTAVVFPLIFLQRWRRHRRRQGGYRKRAITIDGRELSVYRGGGETSTETLERTGKLRKRNRADKNIRKGDDSGSEDETGLGSYLSLPPVLPMIRRASSGLFSVTSSRKSLVRHSDGEMMSGAVQRPGQGQGRRTSNAWIDEDALHGPEMNVSPRKGKKGKGKDRVRRSWRRSIRESWPLKSISPTLPKVASFSSFGSPKLTGDSQQQSRARPTLHDAPSTFRFQHHLATAPRLSIPADKQSPKLQYSPPRQLPKPPRQALLAANDEAAGTPRSMSPASMRYLPRDRGLSYYIYEDTGERPIPAPLRLSAGKGPPRLPSSDSTLTHILSTTDRRLAEGGAMRNRGSLGPSAMGRERSGTVSTGVGAESSLTLVGSSTVSCTPSPPKINFKMHSRVDSQDSVLSEDSLLALPVAEPSPGLGLGYFHGLSSPNKGSPPRQQQHHQQQQQQQMRQRMPIDSPDSALSLSTCPEVDETATDETPTKEALESNDMANFEDQENDDPFVILRDSPAIIAERRFHPAFRGPAVPAHAFVDPPRLQSGPGPLLNRNEITLSFLRSDSPLSAISGNSRSPDLRPRRSLSPQNVHRQPQTLRGGQHTYLPAPTSAVSSTSHLHRRSLSTVPDEEEDEAASIPGTALTSASDKDKISPQAKRLSELCAKASSPTLGRSRDQTPDMPNPRPALPRDSGRALSSYYDTWDEGDNASHASHASQASRSTYRRAAGEVRKPSNSSSSASSTSHYTDSAREKLGAWHSGLGGLAVEDSQRRAQTIRIVPPEHALLPVSSTVAQLRRMNSQVSAYSNAASGHSDGSTASLVLPTLREEGTGRLVSPPRKREASRNYLAMGSVRKGVDVGFGGGNHNDKENEIELDGSRTPDSAAKRLLRVERSPERTSQDSLGLYDADGFWISPERRANRRGE